MRCEPGWATARVAPTGVGWGSAYETGRCGAQIQRRRWRKKQNERVAAFKITSVRRGAAQNFWAPQQGHRPLRQCNKSCGETGRRGRRPPTRSIYYVRLQRAVFFPALCNIIPATFSPPFFPQKGLTAVFFWHTINILKASQSLPPAGGKN